MATNIKLIAVVALIYVTTVCSLCKKSILGCTESSYSFILNPRVYPDKDTINIGDTTWIEISSPTTLKDQISGQLLDYSNASNLGTDMAFQKFISVQPVQVSNAVNDFTFLLRSGKETVSNNPSGNKNFLFEEAAGNYKFKLGILPKYSGLYRFNVSNATGVMRNGNSCPKADFAIIISQTDRHIYFYPGANGGPNGPDYYFYVR